MNLVHPKSGSYQSGMGTKMNEAKDSVKKLSKKELRKLKKKNQ